MYDPTEEKLPKLLSVKKPVIWKDFKKYESEFSKKQSNNDCATANSYVPGHYISTLARFFYRIRTHKLRYFIFKPATRLLHFDLIKSIILNGRENNLAMLALLFELAAITFVAFYFGVYISLFVFGGFGALYVLVYAVRRISLYNEWKKLTCYPDSNKENGQKNEITDDDIFGQPKDKNYITAFMKKNYIAIIAYLFESAAIVFTALYFSLQISLFVFIGFSLFYALIYITRKIVNCCEPKISAGIELDDDNNSKSANLDKEKIQLIENDLNEKPDGLQPDNS